MREPFQDDPFLHAEVQNIVTNNRIRSVIETGTETGVTSNAFAKMPSVKLVVTIDIEKKFSDADLLSTVKFMEGDSRSVLARAIEYVSEPMLAPTLFFLDAHTSNPADECPLRMELLHILASVTANPSRPRPVIVIHDCKVPDRNFGYDTYQGQDVSWDMVADLIEDIYGEHRFSKRYNTVASGSCRGCLFVEPI